VRTDVPGAVRIPAIAPHIAERSRRTSIKKGDVSIETVEHCLAAIRALEIDNIVVEVEGPELPAPDCSSAEYVNVLKQAEIVEQQSPQKEFVIKKPVIVTASDATIYALPYADGGLHITYDLDYSGTAIGRQIYSYPDAGKLRKSMAPRSFLLEAGPPVPGQGETHIGPQDILVIGRWASKRHFATSACATRSWT
jgi:UDP-3-O-acyl-N-acetylglucosamine deacetylase